MRTLIINKDFVFIFLTKISIYTKIVRKYRFFLFTISSHNMMKTVLNKHKKKKKKYICPRCKDPFYTNKELHDHMKKLAKCTKRDASPKILEPCECECGK